MTQICAKIHPTFLFIRSHKKTRIWSFCPPPIPTPPLFWSTYMFNLSDRCCHLFSFVKLLLTLDCTATWRCSLQVAFWNILLLLMNMGPSAVSVILLGAYSDKAGRRKPMTIAVLGTTLRSLTGMCQ